MLHFIVNKSVVDTVIYCLMPADTGNTFGDSVLTERLVIKTDSVLSPYICAYTDGYSESLYLCALTLFPNTLAGCTP